MHYFNSFTEMMGVPASKASPQAMFTWCDDRPQNGFNEDWLLVVNLGDTATDAHIKVGQNPNPVATIPNIGVGQVGTWRVPNYMMDGPVVVSSPSGQNLIVSQRIHYKSSFEEVPGTNPDDLRSGAIFNWYDTHISDGMLNWVLMGNLNNFDMGAFLGIGNALIIDWDEEKQEETPIFKIKANRNRTPLIHDFRGGPLVAGCVDCQGGEKFIYSSRVHYKDSFNELVGKPRNINASSQELWDAYNRVR